METKCDITSFVLVVVIFAFILNIPSDRDIDELLENDIGRILSSQEIKNENYSFRQSSDIYVEQAEYNITGYTAQG